MADMNTTSVCTPVRRGFAPLNCVLCGADACIQLDLADLDTVRCPECDGETTLTEIRETVKTWAAVLAWVDMAPALPE